MRVRIATSLFFSVIILISMGVCRAQASGVSKVISLEPLAYRIFPSVTNIPHLDRLQNATLGTLLNRHENISNEERRTLFVFYSDPSRDEFIDILNPGIEKFLWRVENANPSPSYKLKVPDVFIVTQQTQAALSMVVDNAFYRRMLLVPLTFISDPHQTIRKTFQVKRRIGVDVRTLMMLGTEKAQKFTIPLYDDRFPGYLVEFYLNLEKNMEKKQ